MGDFDGVGRVFRTELNPHPERHPQIDRTDKDRRGKGEGAGHDDEPHDTVELHEDQDEPKRANQPPAAKPKDRKLDISA